MTWLLRLTKCLQNIVKIDQRVLSHTHNPVFYRYFVIIIYFIILNKRIQLDSLPHPKKYIQQMVSLIRASGSSLTDHERSDDIWASRVRMLPQGIYAGASCWPNWINKFYFFQDGLWLKLYSSITKVFKRSIPTFTRNNNLS